MLKFKLLFIVTFFISNACIAQERYTEPSFDEVAVETLTYATKEGEDLELDIYLPQADAKEERATLIYVHGGGFSGGQRDMEKIVDFCTQMANHGYVVASISYRLTRKGKPGGFGCDCPANDKLNTFYAAVEDIQDATFFLIENRHQFAINPQKIILAGSSAGAEAVLNTAYQPPYCYGLDSGPVSFAGVISVAGAIPDTTSLYDESAVPSFFLHGTDDELVPYGTAAHRFCPETKPGYLILHGSQTIAAKLDRLETPYWLHTICGGDHRLASEPLSNYLPQIVDFCYSFVIQGKSEQRHTIVKGKQNNSKVETYNFCSK